MINKRGFDITLETTMYLMLFTIFFVSMFWYITGYQDGAVFWEDVYAKEIANLINRAEPGQEVKIDVSILTGIAKKKGQNLKEVVSIDNVNNRVVVSVRPGRGTSFGFFNDLDIVNFRTELISGKVDANRFIFEVVEKQRDEGG
ncbi:MAG: hypothetical protein Q8P57_02260 [Candidatus Pacearchaeota archaeon]|nr:hypothetical protein [Candidatus Pacearchaeota archaeon]